MPPEALFEKDLLSPAAGDPLKEVLSYLAQFRILLIMDNLETVVDD
jgi:hypothetical protein